MFPDDYLDYLFMPTRTDILGIGQSVVGLSVQVPQNLLDEVKLPCGGEFALVTPSEQRAFIRRLSSFGLRPCEDVGGSVVNSVLAAGSLRGESRLISRVGSDDRAARFVSAVREHGVRFNPISVEGATAACLVAVAPDGQRFMRTTLGVADTVSPDDIKPAMVRQARWTLLEAYMLNCSGGLESLQHALQSARRRAEAAVALTLSDTSIVRRHHSALQELLPQCDLVFGNANEARAMAATECLREALTILGRQVRTAVVTEGANGAYVVEEQRVEHIPGRPSEAVDTTGAGDAFAGALLTALARGVAIKESVEGANLVASRVVEQMGVRVPAPAVAEWGEQMNFKVD